MKTENRAGLLRGEASVPPVLLADGSLACFAAMSQDYRQLSHIEVDSQRGTGVLIPIWTSCPGDAGCTEIPCHSPSPGGCTAWLWRLHPEAWLSSEAPQDEEGNGIRYRAGERRVQTHLLPKMLVLFMHPCCEIWFPIGPISAKEIHLYSCKSTGVWPTLWSML